MWGPLVMHARSLQLVGDQIVVIINNSLMGFLIPPLWSSHKVR